MAGSARRRLSPFGIALAVLIGSLLCAGAVSPAHSRPWKPTPKALAMDYSQIIDNRSANELVLLWWLTPEVMKDTPAVQNMLEKYVVIGVVHAHIGAGGTFTFDKVDALQAMDGNGTALTPLTGDNIPPAVTGALAALEGMLRQALGATGQGMAWFVFDAGSVRSCEKGGLSVPFAGETYTYQTPIPGCS
jgi:hypothetical protein